MYKKYVWDSIGRRKLPEIKYSDIKKFYNHLIREVGFKPNSMETIHTILHPIFATAVRDGYIRVNPTDGVMAEIKKMEDVDNVKEWIKQYPEWLHKEKPVAQAIGMSLNDMGDALTEEEKKLKEMGINPR